MIFGVVGVLVIIGSIAVCWFTFKDKERESTAEVQLPLTKPTEMQQKYVRENNARFERDMKKSFARRGDDTAEDIDNMV